MHKALSALKLGMCLHTSLDKWDGLGSKEPVPLGADSRLSKSTL